VLKQRHLQDLVAEVAFTWLRHPQEMLAMGATSCLKILPVLHLPCFSGFSDQIKSLVLLQLFEGQCSFGDLVFAKYLKVLQTIMFLNGASYILQARSQSNLEETYPFPSIVSTGKISERTPHKQVREGDS